MSTGKIEHIVWNSRLIKINVIRKEDLDPKGMPITVYRIDTQSGTLPIKFNSVTFHQGSITVFNFTGEIFAGKGSLLKLIIEKVPNGVINAQITVVSELDQNDSLMMEENKSLGRIKLGGS
jgi:hypothetical protein